MPRSFASILFKNYIVVSIKPNERKLLINKQKIWIFYLEMFVGEIQSEDFSPYADFV